MPFFFVFAVAAVAAYRSACGIATRTRTCCPLAPASLPSPPPGRGAADAWMHVVAARLTSHDDGAQSAGRLTAAADGASWNDRPSGTNVRASRATSTRMNDVRCGSARWLLRLAERLWSKWRSKTTQGLAGVGGDLTREIARGEGKMTGGVKLWKRKRAKNMSKPVTNKVIAW